MKSLVLLSSVVSLLFVSCARNTPQKRITNFPQRYESLNDKQKSEVTQGRISRGMTKDAVFLALGKPDKTTFGNKNGKEYESWDYYNLQPIVTQGFYGGFGRGFGGGFGRFGGGRFGRFGCGGGGFFNAGWAPQVTYIPRKGASVNFVDEKVESYESVRGSLYR